MRLINNYPMHQFSTWCKSKEYFGIVLFTFRGPSNIIAHEIEQRIMRIGCMWRKIHWARFILLWYHNGEMHTSRIQGWTQGSNFSVLYRPAKRSTFFGCLSAANWSRSWIMTAYGGRLSHETSEKKDATELFFTMPSLTYLGKAYPMCRGIKYKS
jgi:hypothetical protein